MQVRAGPLARLPQVTSGKSVTEWYAVRCIFKSNWLAVLDEVPDGSTYYEERITIWRADSLDHAIALAEAEAVEYAEKLRPEDEYLGLAQAYNLDGPPEHGAEVFSLLRTSSLSPDDYINAFFDTGAENQGHLDDSS